MNNLTSVQTNSEGKFLKNVQFQERYNLLLLIKSCEKVKDIVKLQRIHADILQKDLIMKDVYVATSLLTTYAKCGALEKAKEVFEQLLVKNVVTWNGLITGYVRHGLVNEALECYGRMRSENVAPDVVTYTCILKACGIIGSLEIGEPVAAEVQKQGLFRKDIMLGNTLVDMYAKCGALSKAQELLEGLPVRDVISWNALISGYTQQGQCLEALDCIEKMQSEGISSDVITSICILKVCGSIGAIDKGKEIHNEIVGKRLLENDVMLGNALVDMYVKCGVLAKALDVLEELPVRDIIAWNALISGYAEQGHGHEAVDCFQCMQIEGICGDEVTFLCVLSACVHAGLLDEAQMFFGNMTNKYGITPKLGHHACMVLAFGCAGRFDEAVSVIKAMPSSDYPEIWLVLLSTCRKWSNVKLGKLAFDQALQLDSTSGSAYVLMANVFAAAGFQEEAERMEVMKLKYASGKKPQHDVLMDADGNFSTSFCLGYKTCKDVYI